MSPSTKSEHESPSTAESTQGTFPGPNPEGEGSKNSDLEDQPGKTSIDPKVQEINGERIGKVHKQIPSHSTFLQPFLPRSDPLLPASSSFQSQSPSTSPSPSAPPHPSPAVTRPAGSTRTTTSIHARRTAALQSLCLGTEGVPVHREMLGAFTGVVKRVFGVGHCMVSIMREEVELIGCTNKGAGAGANEEDNDEQDVGETDKASTKSFPPSSTVCPYIINAPYPRHLTIKDVDSSGERIRELPVWRGLPGCAPVRQRRDGAGGDGDGDAKGDGNGKGEGDERDGGKIRFYSGVPLVVRWPGGDDGDGVGSSTSTPGSASSSSTGTSTSPSRNTTTIIPSSSKPRPHSSDYIILGTLCLMDYQPRLGFSEEEEETLRQLADLLVRLICAEQSEGWAMREVGGYKVIIDFLHKTALSEQTTHLTQEDHEREPTGKLLATQPGTAPAGESETNKGVTCPPGTSVLRPQENGFTVVPDDGEEKLSESELYDDAICAICDVIEDCAVVLLDVSQYRIYLKRGEGSKEELHQTLVDQEEPLLQTGYDVRPLAGIMPGTLRSVQKEDLVVKRVRRKREDGQPVGPRRLAAKVADISFHSPYNPDEEVFSEGVGKLLQNMLLTDQYWYESGGDAEVEDHQAIIQEIAPIAKAMLALPVWHSDGSPFKVLVVAWDHRPGRREETERFVRGIVAGTSAAMTIRKARLLEKAQAMFSRVQAHELRTPIHQIKNLATLLRSGVSEGSSKSTLLTAIKDIEVASHRLEMVTNNVLSYFEVQADATETKASRDAIEKKDLLNNHTNRVLEIMMLDLIEAMASTDTNARIQQEDTTPEIEIVLEIMPPFLGETVEEDKNGNLARAIGNIISNALAYINDPQGFVHIVVDDIPSLLPPSGYADLSLTKNVSIQIQDSGIGMDREYLQYHYFRPMKKENELRPGSGLSVHIARRLIATLGGNIAVSSQTGKGTTVHIEVPLTRRRMHEAITADIHPANPDTVASEIHQNQEVKYVYLSGFFGEKYGIGRRIAGEALGRSIGRLGGKVVHKPEEADLLLKSVTPGQEIDFEREKRRAPNAELILLYNTDTQRSPVEKLARDHDKRVFKRPLVPSVLRDVLFKEKEEIAERTKNRDGQNPESPGLEQAPKKSTPPTLRSQARSISQPRLAAPVVSDEKRAPVLVVEDNPINRKILVQYLKKNHWPVEQAVDGEQAVDVFRNITAACIVLLDINMPKMNGFQTSVRMRNIEREQTRKPSQIIAVTALSSEEHRSRGLNDCGMNGWMVKPTNRQQIIDAVERGNKAIQAAIEPEA